MILHAYGDDVTENWIIVETQRFNGIEVLKDELAGAPFLERHKAYSVGRVVRWCECSEIGPEIWFAACICHRESVSGSWRSGVDKSADTCRASSSIADPALDR